MERKPYVPPKAEIIMKGRKKMTAKELREMLYKADDDAPVKIDDEDVVMALRTIDLTTDKDVVRLYSYARSYD